VGLLPVSAIAQDATTAPDKAAKAPKKDTVEGIASLVLAEFLKIGKAWSGVKDAAGAKVASAKMDAVSANLTGLAERLKKLPKPTAAERKTLNEKMEKQEAELQKIFGTLMALGSNKDVAPTMQAAMGKFSETMETIDPVFSAYFDEEAEAATPTGPAVQPKNPKSGPK